MQSLTEAVDYQQQQNIRLKNQTNHKTGNCFQDLRQKTYMPKSWINPGSFCWFACYFFKNNRSLYKL
jgi:hypothetical protein